MLSYTVAKHFSLMFSAEVSVLTTISFDIFFELIERNAVILVWLLLSIL